MLNVVWHGDRFFFMWRIFLNVFLDIVSQRGRHFTDSLCCIIVVSDEQPDRLTSWINKGVSHLATPF